MGWRWAGRWDAVLASLFTGLCCVGGMISAQVVVRPVGAVFVMGELVRGGWLASSGGFQGSRGVIEELASL